MKHNGVTLLELTLVLAILATVFLVTAPILSSTDLTKLDAAAAEVALALQYARSEARRSRTEYGIDVDTSNQLLRVYRRDTAASPPVNSFDVYHPLDKQLFWLNFANDRRFHRVKLSDVRFEYHGLTGTYHSVDFSMLGTPQFDNSGATHLLAAGQLSLSLNTTTRTIHLDPISGRIYQQ